MQEFIVRNEKIVPVLLRTAIFAAIVPCTVGLWLPRRAHRAFSEAPFRVEPERWQINPKPVVVVGWGCDLFVVRVGLQRERPWLARSD